MLARCGRVAHICEANFIGIQFAICFPCCNRTFLNFPVRIWKIREKQRQKFKQGNGAIAARWQAKAGVEPPFAGWFRPFFRKEVAFGIPIAYGSAKIALLFCLCAVRRWLRCLNYFCITLRNLFSRSIFVFRMANRIFLFLLDFNISHQYLC